MKKGQEFEAAVERVLFPNKGIVSVEGEKVIVKNALPGQVVRARINKVRSGTKEAALLEVVKPAPDERTRAEGLCENNGLCGGCTFGAMPYEKQLAMKEEQIKALLTSVTPYEFSFEGIKGSPAPFAYRNKMEFTFGDSEKDGPLTLGLHKRGSTYDILSVPCCQLTHPDFGKITGAVEQFYREKGLPFYHKLRHTGILRHLLVRRSETTGELLVALVTTSGNTEKLALLEFVSLLLSLPLSGKLAGICHLENDSLSDVVRSDKTTVLYGQDFLTEKLLGLSFKVSLFSFFQTNTKGAEVLYETARSFLQTDKEPEIVFDLYSGTGTIAQMMAPAAKEVYGIEIVEEAVEAARENARENGLTNCHFLAGDVLTTIDSLSEKPDILILDPPRDGIHPKALPKLLAYQTPCLLYISCKPTSLIRDLPQIYEAGYTLTRACCVDMFPQTANVECVTLLQRMSNTRERTITLDVEMEDYHRIKNES